MRPPFPDAETCRRAIVEVGHEQLAQLRTLTDPAQRSEEAREMHHRLSGVVERLVLDGYGVEYAELAQQIDEIAAEARELI